MDEFIYLGIEDWDFDCYGFETKMDENHFMKYYYVNEYNNVDVEELVDVDTLDF